VSVLGIALRSLRQRALSSVLTAASVALGVALAVFVTTARDSSQRAFDHAARGYDVVLGGVHTSPLTTVLSTVFHLDKPIDTIPIDAYRKVRDDPRVRWAVPYALGDVYRGFPVVGTTPELFDALFDADGKPLRERMRAGSRVFAAGPEEQFEAVIGAVVAAEAGLRLEDVIRVQHEEGGFEHTDEWEVVGILDPTGTPNDRAVFIQLESFFHVEGHGPPPGANEAEGAKPTDPWAVSSIVVRLKSPATRLQFVRDMRNDGALQAALPFQEIRKLFGIVEDVDALFRVVAALVVIVAGVAILVGLYNAIQGRRREIAILRALGARRAQVFAVVTLEAVLLCLAGGIAGVLLGHAGLAAAAPLLAERFGVRVSAAMGPFDLWVLGALAVLGVVVGALPAWRAFRVEVARNLHPVD
jgi:putative ABC transport system permease protein